MKALTYVVLGDVKKNPGDTVTKAELKAAGQTEDDVKHLIKMGALSEDDKADINEAHKTVEPPEGVKTVTDGGSGADSVK